MDDTNNKCGQHNQRTRMTQTTNVDDTNNKHG